MIVRRRITKQKLGIAAIIAVVTWTFFLLYVHHNIVIGTDSGDTNGWNPQNDNGGYHNSSSSKRCTEGELVDYANDGSPYKCRRMDRNNALPYSNDNDENDNQHHASVHHRLPPTDITLQNHRIGYVTRLCEGVAANDGLPSQSGDDYDDDALFSQCVLPTENNGTTDINSPMPIHTRPWMHDIFSGTSVILHYSSHTKTDMSILALDTTTKRWKKILREDVQLTFEPRICQSLHSPSIRVEEEQRKLYMYVHGHHCNPYLNVTRRDFQPTLLYTSTDGISWTLSQSSVGQWKRSGGVGHPYLFPTLFYMTTPIALKTTASSAGRSSSTSYYYAMARERDESDIVVLTRSSSLEGPYEVVGPILARGLRHFDLFDFRGTLYVLYSMIGDKPERILLGTIAATTISTKEEEEGGKWNEWTFRPGPRVLSPVYWYEHGNAPVVASAGGVARSRHRISDPRLLLDDNVDGDEDDIVPLSSKSNVISGSLFYSVQGEREIAAARISIDLDLYPDATTSLCESADDNMPLPVKEEGIPTTNAYVLITGVDRYGMKHVCKLLRHLGIITDHDDQIDCGTISKRTNTNYKRVIHIVTDPLQTIHAQILDCKGQKKQQCPILALQSWIQQHSYLDRRTNWMVQMEKNASIEPLSLWELCMATGLGSRRCPDLFSLKSQLEDPSLSNLVNYNSLQERPNGDLSWESLTKAVGSDNYKYIDIAQCMALWYGYDL